jgi:hypothetical protein
MRQMVLSPAMVSDPLGRTLRLGTLACLCVALSACVIAPRHGRWHGRVGVRLPLPVIIPIPVPTPAPSPAPSPAPTTSWPEPAAAPSASNPGSAALPTAGGGFELGTVRSVSPAARGVRIAVVFENTQVRYFDVASTALRPGDRVRLESGVLTHDPH